MNIVIIVYDYLLRLTNYIYKLCKEIIKEIV